MSATKSVYGRGWNPIDITGPLGEIDVLIDFVVEEMKERNMEETDLEHLRENLEELSENRSEFMDAVAEYIGDSYALYSCAAEYNQAEQVWAEYKMNDVEMK
jgi:hypothetical protein